MCKSFQIRDGLKKVIFCQRFSQLVQTILTFGYIMIYKEDNQRAK